MKVVGLVCMAIVAITTTTVDAKRQAGGILGGHDLTNAIPSMKKGHGKAIRPDPKKRQEAMDLTTMIGEKRLLGWRAVDQN